MAGGEPIERETMFLIDELRLRGATLYPPFVSRGMVHERHLTLNPCVVARLMYQLMASSRGTGIMTSFPPLSATRREETLNLDYEPRAFMEQSTSYGRKEKP